MQCKCWNSNPGLPYSNPGLLLLCRIAYSLSAMDKYTYFQGLPRKFLQWDRGLYITNWLPVILQILFNPQSTLWSQYSHSLYLTEKKPNHRKMNMHSQLEMGKVGFDPRCGPPWSSPACLPPPTPVPPTRCKAEGYAHREIGWLAA